MTRSRILVVRLGAMGDIIHALPAVASLKQSYPHSHVAWAVESKWASLLEGNPFIDECVEVDRSTVGALLDVRSRLRTRPFDIAVDFQGLLKSAVIASFGRASRVFGPDRSCAREKVAALFYSHAVKPTALHIVDRHLEIAVAAGAATIVRRFHIPEGRPEGQLPDGPFVFANPSAGWTSKQWPLDRYTELAALIHAKWNLPLVINGPDKSDVPGAWIHTSSVAGLIHATRRALAVVGVDSGPLHLAAALGKPGVAIFGPTDPARNGPYGGTITVLRAPHAHTSYKRRDVIDESMRMIDAAQVADALAPHLARALKF
jgi:heptosyltransferase-1